ncbi:MAG: PrsW family intramembrane metalloprotease [Candidatus Dormibacteraeota bacterium]|nr:PrsW family intramembrane metalloprotease [Candidatus Dormibacteraeota bacterium]
MRRWRWLIVLLGGLAIWFLSVIVTAITGNPNLVPTVVLFGSFLIPVTAVVWNFDHEADSAISGQRVAYAFIAGGALGVIAASVLEALLVQNGALQYIVVGLIEEFVKLAVLFAFAAGLARYTTRDGVVLGAAVGFGFAALESSGYAFVALLSQHGLSLSSLVETEILRGILAPVGHGLWTAIVGAVLFRGASRRGHLRITWGLVGVYLLVSVLHALWDSARGIALFLTLLLTATPQQVTQLQHGTVPRIAAAQVLFFDVLEFGGMVVDSLIAIGALVLLWQVWVRREAPIGTDQG